MNETSGDIWDFHEDGNLIGITTNIGWTRGGNGIMGLGTAHQAALRYPPIVRRWGQCCINGKENTPVTVFPWNLVMIPTKPLNPLEPHMSWQGPATLDLVQRSLRQLAALTTPVYLPTLGTGLGRLPLTIVLDLMRKELRDTPHTIVHKELGKRVHIV
jgi:hypothetical protein